MKLTLAEPKYLKDSISIISELVNEAQFKITKDAIELVAMDPANVAMVIFKLWSSSFTEYDVDKEVTISLNLSYLKQILRRAKPTDMITLEMEAANRLKITFRSHSVRTFGLAIIDTQEHEQRIPQLSFPVSVETTAEVLNEAIEDVDIVSESVSLQVEQGKFSIHAEGDMSNAVIEVKADDKTAIKAAKEPVKSKYSVEYLKKMIQAGKIADAVRIQFNKDYPLKLDYHTVDRVMLSFVLAPRVDND
ncbi:MAG: proliferating cell nuclear antigen (pcna) [Nanoarchaeota archaeon]|nr:MAG: proliferating cell nuclear antigen (pcna) [Nanoarchaeota archaeon]